MSGFYACGRCRAPLGSTCQPPARLREPRKSRHLHWISHDVLLILVRNTVLQSSRIGEMDRSLDEIISERPAVGWFMALLPGCILTAHSEGESSAKGAARRSRSRKASTATASTASRGVSKRWSSKGERVWCVESGIALPTSQQVPLPP